MNAKTAVSVGTKDPKDQVDADIPFDLTIADLSGHREPPENDAEVEEDPASRLKPEEVTPGNHERLVREKWKPRVKASVPNHLGDNPDETLLVDVTFQRGTQFWAAELDQIPEIQSVLQVVAQIDRLQSALASRPPVRKKLAGLIENLINQ
jgi:type VI secretion system ImpB/VipA family protein